MKAAHTVHFPRKTSEFCFSSLIKFEIGEDKLKMGLEPSIEEAR